MFHVALFFLLKEGIFALHLLLAYNPSIWEVKKKNQEFKTSLSYIKKERNQVWWFIPLITIFVIQPRQFSEIPSYGNTSTFYKEILFSIGRFKDWKKIENFIHAYNVFWFNLPPNSLPEIPHFSVLFPFNFTDSKIFLVLAFFFFPLGFLETGCGDYFYVTLTQARVIWKEGKLNLHKIQHFLH